MNIVKERPSDLILNSLNRLYDAKLSGALKNDELSKIMILEGDMFASKIKQGKINVDEVESFESFISGFTKDTKDNYFSYQHTDLDRAAKMILEGNDMALEQGLRYSQTVESPNYTKGFRKLM